MGWVAAAAPYIPAALGAVGGLFGGGGPTDGPLARRQPGGQEYKKFLNQYMTDPSQWAQFFPGQTYASQNPYEAAGIAGLGQYGMNLAPQLAPYMDASTAAVSGATPASQFANQFAGAAGANIGGIFERPNDITQPGFDPTQYATSYGDPSGAFASLLSGQPDYAGLSGAFAAAMDPVYQQFNERTLPALTLAGNAATGGQGGSGIFKAAQRGLQDINRTGTNLANQMTFAEMQAAKQRQAAAAGQVGQLNQAGLGLGANIADIGARLNLSTQLANQQGGESYANRLLSAAGQGGTMLGNVSADQLRALAIAPQTVGLGALPYGYLSQAGAAQRGIEQMPIDEAVARFNYNETLPFNSMTQGWNALQSVFAPTGATAQPSTGDNIMSALMAASAFWPKTGTGSSTPAPLTPFQQFDPTGYINKIFEIQR